MFTDKEVAYINSQRLVRLATVSKEGQPDVAPVGFRFDGQVFIVGGFNIARTLKYRNVKANPHVALVIDDLETIDPWRPRNVKVHGLAEVVEEPGKDAYLRIAPERHWSMGLEDQVLEGGRPIMRKVDWRRSS